MRLIDADALYERICDLEAQALAYVRDETDPDNLRGWSAILAERTAFKHDIIDAPTIEPEPQWIPCSEGMPKEKDAGILKKLGKSKRSEYVLATVEVKGERMTVTACTYDGEWDWNMKYAFPDYKIIAWMPLPEPYKEDTDGDK